MGGFGPAAQLPGPEFSAIVFAVYDVTLWLFHERITKGQTAITKNKVSAYFWQ
jgi:hypothetical protein